MPTYTDLKRYGDHVLGGTLVLVFLAASLMADLYGVSAVMNNSYSIWNQGLIAGGCVLIKACGFYKMRSAWREGYVSAAIAMGALTVVVLVVSITNEMTYYHTNFADKSAHLENQVAISSDAAKEKAAIEDRLAKTADVRQPAAIEGDITVALAKRVRGDKNDRTIGNATEYCAATKHWAYDQCANVLALRAELANAVVVTPQIEKDRARLDAIRASKAWASSVGEVHPGAAFWVHAYNHVVDWRGLDARHHITAEEAQDVVVVVFMLALQLLNLFLPFAWFYRQPENVAVTMQVAVETKPQLVESLASISAAIASGNVTGNAANKLTGSPASDAADNVAGHLASNGNGNGDTVTSSVASNVANDVRGASPKLADMQSFVDRYCVQGADFSERSRDIHAAYALTTDLPNPLDHPHFSRQLRALVGGRLKENPRDHEGKRLMLGLKLNEEGRKLMADGHFKEFGVNSARPFNHGSQVRFMSRIC